MKIMTCLLVLFITINLHAAPAGIKNEDGSFKVSEKAIQVMGIKFQKLQNTGPWEIPKDALVKIKFTQGVYRKYEGNITYVIVTVLKVNEQSLTLKSEDLEAGDEVATAGVNFLRLTEADLNSETIDNCAH